jgi:hypothetical protein
VSRQRSLRVVVLLVSHSAFFRDLSNGHFSRDNQKKLNANETDIPIYEAKMTGNLRLVVCAVLFASEL